MQLDNREGFVLVDFYADWCGPCKIMEPVVEKVAAEHDFELVKVNIDEEQGLAAQYGIMSIPTVILFKDGEPIEIHVGATSKARLEKALDLIG